MLTPVLPFPRPGFVVEHVATADATRLKAAREAARAQRSQEVQPRAAPGQSLQQIARAGGVSRQTVRPWLQTAPLPPEQRGYRGPGKIAPSLPYLRTRTAGARSCQTRRG